MSYQPVADTEWTVTVMNRFCFKISQSSVNCREIWHVCQKTAMKLDGFLMK